MNIYGIRRWQAVVLVALLLTMVWFIYTSLSGGSGSFGDKIRAGIIQGDHISSLIKLTPSLVPVDVSALSKGTKHMETESTSSPNTLKFHPSDSKENNVVAMSLYGNENPRYTTGILHNIDLLKKNFPGWSLRLYVEKRSDKMKYGKPPQPLLDKLKSLGTDIRYMDPNEIKIPPMMWRFLIADDMTVDRFIIRDCDSRLTERDAATVAEWVKSGKPFHCIRDHPSHSSYSVSGGLWGGKPKELKKIFNKEFKEMMVGYTTAYVQDMHFLGKAVWPKVKDQYAYCHDSYSCDKFPSSHPFPVKRNGAEHIGEVYDANDVGRAGDIAIIKRTPVNKKCVPP